MHWSLRVGPRGRQDVANVGLLRASPSVAVAIALDRLPVVTGKSHFAQAAPPYVAEPRPELLARSSGLSTALCHAAGSVQAYRIVCLAWTAAQRRMQSVPPRPAPCANAVLGVCQPSDAVVIQRSPAIVRGAGTFAVSAQSPTDTDTRRRRGLAREADIDRDRSESLRCRPCILREV